MPRDYKSQRRQRTSRKATSRWPWFFTGLAVGLFVALLVYLSERVPDQIALIQARKESSEKETPKKGQPENQPTQPSYDRPQFEFYTILPEMEITVPDSEVQVATQPEPERKETDEASGSYMLQVGSFQKLEQADELKATLALLGFEAEIQSVAVNGGETWHRVRLGPYTDLARLNETRIRLRKNNIEALLLKIKI